MSVRPRTPVVQDFDPARYAGIWYEVGSAPLAYTDDCNGAIAQYSWSAQARRLYVRNNCLVDGRVVRQRLGYAEPATDNVKVGRLNLYFADAPGQRASRQGSYWVLATDYIDFALVGSRALISGRNVEYLWLLSRAPTVMPTMAAFWLRKAAARNFAFWRVRVWPDRLVGDARNARRAGFVRRRDGKYYTLPKSAFSVRSRANGDDDDAASTFPSEEGGLCALITFSRLQDQLFHDYGFYDINSLIEPLDAATLNADPEAMRRWIERNNANMMRKLAELQMQRAQYM